jgi:hypothetical protein
MGPDLRQEAPRRGEQQLRWRRGGFAVSQRRQQNTVIGAFERRAPDIFDPHAREPVAVEVEQPRCLDGEIDQPVVVIGPAVIHPHDDRAAVGQIGDAGIARQRQRRMRGRNPVHVVDLAIGGLAAVKIVAIPGREALRAIVRVFLGDVSLAADHIGAPDPVGAAAFRHRLARTDDARARRHAVARVDPAELVGGRAARQCQADDAGQTGARPPPPRHATPTHRSPVQKSAPPGPLRQRRNPDDSDPWRNVDPNRPRRYRPL